MGPASDGSQADVRRQAAEASHRIEAAIRAAPEIKVPEAIGTGLDSGSEAAAHGWSSTSWAMVCRLMALTPPRAR